jgi:hypothetical protein
MRKLLRTVAKLVAKAPEGTEEVRESHMAGDESHCRDAFSCSFSRLLPAIAVGFGWWVLLVVGLRKMM